MKVFAWIKSNTYLILSALLGLTPVLWYRGKPIAGEEFYAVNYARWIDIFARTWEPYMNYGESPILIPLKLQGWFFFALDFLKISNYLGQIIWYVFLWTLTSVAFYIFVKKLFDKSVHESVLFVATIYYVFSPFFLNISPFLTPPRIVFIAVPLIFSILLELFRSDKVILKNLFKLAFVIFLSSPAFVNLPAGLVLLFVIALGIIYKYLAIDRDYKKFLVSFGYFSLFTVLLSLWWLVPVVGQVYSNTGSIKAVASEFSAVSSSQIQDVLSQFGSWAFREKIWGYNYYYFTYNKAYDSFPLIIVRYIPLTFVLLGVYYLINLVKSKKSLNSQEEFHIFLLILFCLFTFLSKGSSGLMGGFYDFIYKYVPFFWVFREPYAKFLPVAAAASGPLIILGFAFLSKYIKQYKNVTLIALAASFLYIGYPIWNGEVVWTINDRDVRSYEVEMPLHWHRFINEWKPAKGYYLLFPSNGMTEKYVWPSGYIGNPYLLFTDAKIINPVSAYSKNDGVQKVVNFLYNKIFHDPAWLIRNAERYNISGLVFQSDVSDQSYVLKRDLYQEIYKNFRSFSVDTVDTYNFPSAAKETTEFSVIPENKLIWLDPAVIQEYTFVKRLLPESAYIVFTEDTSKFNALWIPNDEKLSPADSQIKTFDFQNVKKGNYIALVGDKHNFLNNVTADGNTLESTSSNQVRSFDLNLDFSCCYNLQFEVKPPVELKLQEDWRVLKRTDKGMQEFMYAGQDLDLTTTGNSYYKRVEDYDTEADHMFLLSGNSVGAEGFSMFMAHRDTDIQKEVALVGGQIPNISGDLIGTLPKFDFVNSSYNQVYYLIIKKPEAADNIDRISNNYATLRTVKLARIYQPDILLVDKARFSEFDNNQVTPAEERKLDATTILTKVSEGSNGGYLQFKNAYNKKWRLITLTENDWENAGGSSLDKVLLKSRILLKSFGGRSPENIEYYSNAWKLDSDSRVYAVTFATESVVRILFGVALLVIIFGVYKKWLR